MTTESQTNMRNNEITVKELLLRIQKWSYFIISKWIVILLLCFIGGVTGFSYAYFKKPVYTAITTFVLEEGNAGASALSSLGGLASIAGVDLGNDGGGLFQGDNILELYTSRSMIEKTLFTEVKEVSKSVLLINKYIEVNNLRKEWVDKPELLNLRFKVNNVHLTSIDGHKDMNRRLQDSIIGVIVNDVRKNNLTVTKPDKKLSIIKVEVRGKDEFFTKNFNEQIVKNVNDFYLQTKTKKSLNNIAILQQKTDSVRAVMNGEIFSVAAIMDATPNLNPTRQIKRVAPAQKSQFSAETNKAILGTLVQNLEMSKMSLMKEAPLIQVVDQPIYPLDTDKTSKFKAGILGALLFGFLTVLYLLINKALKLILM